MVKMPFEKKHTLSPTEIAKLIDKGAPVKGDEKEDDKYGIVAVNLRMRKAMLNEIDEAIKYEEDRQGINLTRTAWLLQLIHKEIKMIQKEMKQLRNENI